ncbi:GFA family protein [Carnimonas bestiolae]|uniref:GFA family protein n=1 Tax=Carnimonas bestiolae TaxID=3402172 RepID=UPI003EDB9CBD
MLEGQCLCGENRLVMTGEPLARANCHCASCRDVYGGSFLSATAWQPSQLTLSASNCRDFSHPTKRLTRTYCASCGDILFGTNRLGMNVVPNQMIARSHQGVLPAHLTPEMHIFYTQRIVDVNDTLVKYSEGWNGPTLD